MKRELRNLPCLVPGCFAFSVYVAMDNRAEYGHVCRYCWSCLSREEQQLYAELDNRPVRIWHQKEEP